MVKFNPGLSQILSTIFLLRACNSSLQNTVEPLLWDTVTIYMKCFSKQCIGRWTKKLDQNFNPGLALIGLSGTGPRRAAKFLPLPPHPLLLPPPNLLGGDFVARWSDTSPSNYVPSVTGWTDSLADVHSAIDFNGPPETLCSCKKEQRSVSNNLVSTSKINPS